VGPSPGVLESTATPQGRGLFGLAFSAGQITAWALLEARHIKQRRLRPGCGKESRGAWSRVVTMNFSFSKCAGAEMVLWSLSKLHDCKKYSSSWHVGVWRGTFRPVLAKEHKATDGCDEK
jgi:hypothetical protein